MGPHVTEMEQSNGAGMTWELRSSPTARLPAVRSSRRALSDLAHLLSHLAGPIVDGKDDGGGNGGAAGLDHGKTPVEATATR